MNGQAWLSDNPHKVEMSWEEEEGEVTFFISISLNSQNQLMCLCIILPHEIWKERKYLNVKYIIFNQNSDLSLISLYTYTSNVQIW
jgi:hypothetical protein